MTDSHTAMWHVEVGYAMSERYARQLGGWYGDRFRGYHGPLLQCETASMAEGWMAGCVVEGGKAGNELRWTPGVWRPTAAVFFSVHFCP